MENADLDELTAEEEAELETALNGTLGALRRLNAAQDRIIEQVERLHSTIEQAIKSEKELRIGWMAYDAFKGYNQTYRA